MPKVPATSLLFLQHRLESLLRATATLLIPVQLLTLTPVLIATQAAAATSPALNVSLAPTSTSASRIAPPAEALERQEEAVASSRALKAKELPAIAPAQSVVGELPSRPTDGQIMHCGILSEQLVPFGETFPEENEALGRALSQFHERADRFDDSALTYFLKQYPESAWRISLFANLASLYERSGFFTRAENALRQAWSLAPREPNLDQQLVIAFVVSHLAELFAHGGKDDDLRTLLEASKNVKLFAGTHEKLTRAKKVGEVRQKTPTATGACGVEAVTNLFRFKNEKGALPKVLTNPTERALLGVEPPPGGGVTLGQVQRIASAAGIKLIAAKRQENVRIPVPAVLHWKRGHFAAVVKRAGTQYLVRDASLGGEMWMPEKALDEECSGYALVSGDALSKGWAAAGASDLASVQGKTYAPIYPPEDDTTCENGKCDSGACCGMPQYLLSRGHTAVKITDTPLSYRSATSAPIDMTINYASRQSNPAPTDDSPNVGRGWTFQMLSYVDDSTVGLWSQETVVYNQAGNPVAGIDAEWAGQADIYLPGGGIEHHKVTGPHDVKAVNDLNVCLRGMHPQFEREWRSRVQLSRVAGSTGYKSSIGNWCDGGFGGSGSIYHRVQPDGTRQVFDFFHNGKVYLTQIVKPNGWVTKYVLVHDNTAPNDPFRILRIEEGLPGQVPFTTLVTFYYEDTRAGFEQLITKVTDVAGRSAHFTYNALKQLESVSDVGGITTTFAYDAATTGNVDFIESMTTPYGTTRFKQGYGAVGDMMWVEAIDPLGARERVETYLGQVPNNFPDTEALVPAGMNVYNLELSCRNTFYWNKKAMSEAATADDDNDGWPDAPMNGFDLSKAHLTHWQWDAIARRLVTIPQCEKAPLEGRVWYQYEGQNGSSDTLSFSQLPQKIGRVLDATGTTQLRQYEYTYDGKVSKSIDSRGRETKYTYQLNGLTGTNNLIQIEQKNQGGGYDIQAKYNYQNQTYKALDLTDSTEDSAGKVTSYTYNANGKPQNVTRTRKGADGITRDEVTTCYYYSSTASLGSRRRLQRVEGPGGVRLVSFTYDGAGRIHSRTNSDGYTLKYDYDNLDRPLRITYPDGTYEDTIYAAGKLDAEWRRDRKGRWTHFEHNEGRQLVAVTDPAGRVTQFDHCPCGALEAIVDAKQQRTEFTYDIQMRVEEKIYEGGTQKITYAYEPFSGRLDYTLDPNGNKTDFTYNVDNTLASVAYLDGNGAAIASTPGVSYEYDLFYNRVSKVTTAGREEKSYGYVPFNRSNTEYGDGRLQTETTKDLAAGGATLHNLTHAYDEYGRELSCAIDGTASGRTYDDLGRIAVATNALGTFNYSYVGATGRLDHVDYPNGQRTRYSYHPAIAAAGTNDGDFRLRQILNTTQDGTRVISQFDYKYDVVGNVLDCTQEQEDALVQQNYHFGYDPADQLIGATLTQVAGGNVLQELGYKYDLAGNREVEQVGTVQSNGTREVSITEASYNPLNQMTARTGGSGLATFEGTVNEPARVKIAGQQASTLWKKGTQEYGFRGTAQLNAGANTVQIEARDGNNNASYLNVNVQANGTAIPSMTYDANGNLRTASGCTYAWDAANRLISIAYSDGSKTEFSYNGLGQRTRLVERSIAGAITEDRRFVWCGMELREERNDSNQVVKRFEVQGVQQLFPGTATPSEKYFYTRDHLGSVRDVTNSQKGAWTRMSYDPWGRKKDLSLEHKEAGTSGQRQHYFTGATKTLPIAAGDKLVAYVYLAPQNPPQTIMLQWNVNGDWNHRAYWGADLLQWGVRTYKGPLPATGKWVRLEVPANDVGLEGQTVSGMSFDVYGGEVKWDHAGKVNSAGDKDTVWFDDALPTGAVPVGTWNWVPSTSGPKADFGFTGHFYHEKSGLDLTYYRAYSAELGRWLSRDPLNEAAMRANIVADGMTTTAENYVAPMEVESQIGTNLYQYVWNNPLAFSDASGLCPKCQVDAESAVASMTDLQLAEAAESGCPMLQRVVKAERALRNKLNHIFSKEQHNLGDFLAQYGSEREAYKALLEAAKQEVQRLGIQSETFLSRSNPLVVTVGGFVIKVGGIVKDGCLNIGTFFQ